MRGWIAAAVVAAGALALVIVVTTGGDAADSASGAAGSARRAPITILWIGDTTGPVKVYGDVQLAGVKGAADYFNRHGGIEGHRVVVHAVSDNGDPTLAASVLTQQLARRTPTMVWAGSFAAVAGALIPVLARHDVFSISLVDGQAQCAAEASAKCANQWFLSGSTSVIQQSVAGWMQAKRLTKVGVLAETTTQNAAQVPHFLQAAERAGLSVKTASFTATAVDLTPQLESLKRSGAQVVYAAGLGAAKYAFAARANLSWDVPLLFDPSASALDLTKLTTPANLGNAYESTLYAQDARVANPGLETMVKWSERYADVTALPLVPTSTGWDAVVALNAAVKEAGGALDVAKLDAAMLRLPATDPLRTLSHRLGWTKDNHENTLAAPEDYVTIPVGPLAHGQVQAR